MLPPTSSSIDDQCAVAVSGLDAFQSFMQKRGHEFFRQSVEVGGWQMRDGHLHFKVDQQGALETQNLTGPQHTITESPYALEGNSNLGGSHDGMMDLLGRTFCFGCRRLQ
jgi:hypothetical protein